MNAVVQRIDALRASKGLSQNQFAKQIGVSANTVYHWSKTDAMPSLANIERICAVFGITVEQFFHGINSPKSNDDSVNFLVEWRALSPKEKEAVRYVMEAFNSIREAKE